MYLPPVISQIFYAVLLSPLQPKQSASAQLQSALLKNKSSFDRTMSAVNLVDRVIPGTANRLSRWMYKNDSFPWAPVDTELIAFGTDTAVLQIKRPDFDDVLRIYCRSPGKSFRGLVEIASYYRRNNEVDTIWYGCLPEQVHPMQVL